MQQQIKSACIACNTGWMSRLQTATSPIALQFVRGHFPHLPDRERTILSAWATMVTMNLEYYDPATVAVPQSQRSSIWLSGSPPAGWYVGLGRYQGERFRSSFYHRASVITDGLELPETFPEEDKAQSTVFGLGQVLFHTVSAGSAMRLQQIMGDDPGLYGDASGLRTIWPISKPNLYAILQPFDDFRVQGLIDMLGAPDIRRGPTS